MKVFKILIYPFKVLFLIPVWVYKFCISPILPHTCRFTPTCSNYFIGAVKSFGIFKGSILGVKRIARCKPSGDCGFDFIPINLKGESKWLF